MDLRMYSWNLKALAALLVLFSVSPVFAAAERPDNAVAISEPPPGYVARIELNDPDQVQAALERAEQFYLSNKLSTELPPVVLVVHGNEVDIFDKQNYDKYKPIVDLAARLHAFKVIDVRVCRTRMRIRDIQANNLYPFVGTVSLGRREISRLIKKEDYLYF